MAAPASRSYAFLVEPTFIGPFPEAPSGGTFKLGSFSLWVAANTL